MSSLYPIPRPPLHLIDYSQEIVEFLNQKDFSSECDSQHFMSEHCRWGIFHDFGTGHSADLLAEELLRFRNEYRKGLTSAWSYWAIFEGTSRFEEWDFEESLWRELSSLNTCDANDETWEPAFAENITEKNYCFRFGGVSFFAMGLHPGSSRWSRRFSRPSIVFNIYDVSL